MIKINYLLIRDDMMYDLIVVGAGPSGCRVAELASKRGLKTAIIDKKKKIGEPVQCTGLISSRIKTLLPDIPKNVFLNEISKARFYSSSKELELNSKKPFVVVNRAALDTFLLHKAKKEGVDVGMDVTFKDYEYVEEENEIKKGEVSHIEKTEFIVVSTTEGKMKTKLLVGADGPISTVASKSKLCRPPNMLTGSQMTVECKNLFNPDSVELYFNESVTPDFFGWVVPLNENKARIGLGAKKNASNLLKKFIENRTGGLVKKSEVKIDVAGRINFGIMNETVEKRVMVVGDAAAQVKPFSGGGVVYGLMGAGFCANACIKAIKEDNFSKEFLSKEYDKKWKEHLSVPIKKGLIMRKAFFGFDGKISNFRTNLILLLANLAKPFLERLDGDLL